MTLQEITFLRSEKQLKICLLRCPRSLSSERCTTLSTAVRSPAEASVGVFSAIFGAGARAASFPAIRGNLAGLSSAVTTSCLFFSARGVVVVYCTTWRFRIDFRHGSRCSWQRSCRLTLLLDRRRRTASPPSRLFLFPTIWTMVFSTLPGSKLWELALSGLIYRSSSLSPAPFPGWLFL